MSTLTHRYKYAISDKGKPIFIDEITQENRRDTTYTCAGCGRQLFPVLSEKRERHFRHEKDSECSDYNRYLHEYGKAVLKKRFEEGETFIVQYYAYQECKLFQTCHVHQNHNWEKCSFHGLYSIDLKQYYDTCIPEKGFYEETLDGKKRYVADLKLISSESNIPPTILEVWVNHECSEEKKNSGSHIIEIKIEQEKDAWRDIIETDDGADKPIHFYGFKDFIATEPQFSFKHIKAMRTLSSPYSIVVDESSCNEKITFDEKSLFEIVISTDKLKDSEYLEIFAATLQETKSAYIYKLGRFCPHFRSRFDRGREYLNCVYIRNRIAASCPCDNYSFDKTKIKELLERLRKNDVEIWYKDKDVE